MTGILSLPLVLEESKVEMNFLTILEKIEILSDFKLALSDEEDNSETHSFELLEKGSTKRLALSDADEKTPGLNRGGIVVLPVNFNIFFLNLKSMLQ